MKHILLVLLAGSILSIQNLHAQSAVHMFNEAYGDYENGNYQAGLSKLSRLENELGATNAKIESLRTLLYNEQGDTRNALLSAEKYFKTKPDPRSDGYGSMRSLYDELKSIMQTDFASRKDQLEKSRKAELANVDTDKKRETDQYHYNIARSSGTIQALQLFLSKNSTRSLEDSAKYLIGQIKLEQKQERLVNEGIKLLSDGKSREAVLKLQSAQEIKFSSAVKLIIDDAKEFSRKAAISDGNMAMLEEQWSKAVAEFKYALSVKSDSETQKSLYKATEELEYYTALRSKDPVLVSQYLQKYTNGIKRNHAETFLFEHYLAAGFSDKKEKDLSGMQANIGQLKTLKSTRNWKIFANAYYELVLDHAKLLGQAKKKIRRNNISQEIAHYEELDSESGKNYDAKISALKWKKKEWNRPGRFYLAYQTESSFTDIGLGIGYLSNSGLGFIFQARGSLQVWAANEDESFDTKGKTVQKGVINLIFTKKVIHPLFIYAGGGAAFVNRILPDPVDAGKGYVYADDELTTPNAEAGVIIAIKPITISGGVSMPYLSKKNKELLGITEYPLEIALGVGIAL